MMPRHHDKPIRGMTVKRGVSSPTIVKDIMKNRMPVGIRTLDETCLRAYGLYSEPQSYNIMHPYIEKASTARARTTFIVAISRIRRNQGPLPSSSERMNLQMERRPLSMDVSGTCIGKR